MLAHPTQVDQGVRHRVVHVDQACSCLILLTVMRSPSVSPRDRPSFFLEAEYLIPGDLELGARPRVGAARVLLACGISSNTDVHETIADCGGGA